MISSAANVEPHSKDVNQVVMIILGDDVPLTWHWQPGLLLLVGAVGFFYGRGWRRARVTSEPITQWRLISFVGGILLLLVALISPLYDLGSYYLFARVSQHILILAPVPALLMAGNPWPIIKLGLPRSWQRWVTAHWGAGTEGRGRIAQYTPVGAIWIGFLACFSLWYDPVLHAAARQIPWLRSLEWLTMLAGALVYWWIVAQARPRLHPLPNFWLRVLFAGIGAFPIKVLGGLLLFSETIIYAYPANDIQVLDVAGEQAQQYLGAIIVWFLGGVTFTNAAFILIRNWLQIEEGKPTLYIDRLSTEKRMLAPGLEPKKP